MTWLMQGWGTAPTVVTEEPAQRFDPKDPSACVRTVEEMGNGPGMGRSPGDPDAPPIPFLPYDCPYCHLATDRLHRYCVGEVCGDCLEWMVREDEHAERDAGPSPYLADPPMRW